LVFLKNIRDAVVILFFQRNTTASLTLACIDEVILVSAYVVIVWYLVIFQ
jgi:hypothetical protein